MKQEWVSDSNGNKCSASYFGSVEAAQMKTLLTCILLLNSSLAFCSEYNDIPKFFPGDVVMHKEWKRKMRILELLPRSCDPSAPSKGHMSCDDFSYMAEFAPNTVPVIVSTWQLKRVSK